MTPDTRPALPDEEADARERLLAAAQDAFAERGFEGATVRDICRTAGANIAAVNYYFGDKEKLYVESVKRAHVCAARMDAFPISADAPPVEKLRAFIREMVARMHTPASTSAMKLMMREMADPGKAAHVVVSEFIQPVAFVLRAILREMLPHLDEQHLLMTGFSIIGQCLYYRQNRPVSELIFGKEAVAALDATAVADHVIRFSLAALGHADPIGAPITGAAKTNKSKAKK
ncbi:HTH-type transcriptional repressor AcnR [Gemmata sp. SH-PL17]|uniref:CerR family C-terminal domain-containing protein n=1 Tax=Gemmata sp. SH-PL17 TaxID=1630693 RepID=UPI00078DD9E4|nr:CerR family C-terminal domain-containing protein [Gemmata sp. SH-PL17]AMV26633.1 HTH-type transcriptional repressor AcnR [Gemmata sp. SH-PL17]